jgi:CRP/FNR family cyclic AMP-dependent transcriptional regulator
MRNAGAASVLRCHPIFQGLSAELLAKIATLCENREYRRGDIVFAEGQPGTRLYGVIAGRLIITTTSADGQELNLNVAEAGEILGEIAFLDGGPRTASGRAAEPTTCFAIERAPFFQLLERSPTLSVHLLQLVCKRVRWMTSLVADSAFRSVPQRMATRLSHLAKPDAEGTGAIVRISQAELAQFLGITRQVVNQYLQTWQRAGLVELKRGAIRIRDLHALP